MGNKKEEKTKLKKLLSRLRLTLLVFFFKLSDLMGSVTHPNVLQGNTDTFFNFPNVIAMKWKTSKPNSFLSKVVTTGNSCLGPSNRC